MGLAILIFIVKLDSAGGLQWTKSIGGSGYDESWSIVQTDDKGLAIVGTTNSFGGAINNTFVVKLDSFGNLKWTKVDSGVNGFAIVQTKDKGLAIAGNTHSYEAGGWDVLFLNLDSAGNFCAPLITDSGRISSGGTIGNGNAITSVDSGRVFKSGGMVNNGGTLTSICSILNSVITPSNTSAIAVYPNPASSVLSINMPKAEQGWLELYNELGQLIINYQLRTVNEAVDVSKLPDGIYCYRIVSANGELRRTGKVIIER